MKKKNWLFAGLAAGLLFGSVACSNNEEPGNGGGSGNNEDDPALAAILNNYVDRTVIPTYTDMKEKVWTLLEKVEAATAEGATQNDIDIACNAWREAREPWEKSEGFLYGPAHDYSLDPHLDSWPLDLKNITNILNSSIDLSSSNVRETLSQNVIGFHTLEYLLFDDSQPRPIASLSDRQKEYMLAVSTVLRDDALKLWAFWVGADVVAEAPRRDRDIIDGKEGTEYEDGLDLALTAAGYGAMLKNPVMSPAATYKTQFDCINQILDGCIEIANEVGDQKIGNPWRDHDVYAVESWYSWNSLEDYENNIISIENSYLGGPEGNRDASTSLSAWVAEKNPQIDQEVTAAIAATRKALNPSTGIPYPFRTQVEKQQNGDKVEAAMNACAELKTQLERIKTLLK